MRRTTVLAACVLLGVPALAAGQPPAVQNGRVIERAAGAGVAGAVRELAAASGTDVVWVGYAVAAAPGTGDACCWSDARGGRYGCRLEPQGGAAAATAPGTSAARPVALEPDGRVAVLVRLEGGQPERVRVVSMSCPLEAGGRTVHWLTGVAPADSVALLAGYASGPGARRLVDGALTAVALHADAAAVAWLLRAARDGATPHLRGQALFWLSQRAGRAAVGAITEAIDRDPDTDVKRRAVFALSQLPADEGLPRLIEVARAHSNPAVRRQAFFWLGQSKDPRALAFFREILTSQKPGRI